MRFKSRPQMIILVLWWGGWEDGREWEEEEGRLVVEDIR